MCKYNPKTDKLCDIPGHKYAEFSELCTGCTRGKCGNTRNLFRRYCLMKASCFPAGLTILEDWTIDCEFFKQSFRKTPEELAENRAKKIKTKAREKGQLDLFGKSEDKE